MHTEISRHSDVDSVLELEKRGTAMTPVQFADHLAGGDVEGSAQRRRAMAHVVMGTPLGKTRRQRQYGPGSVQRLNYADLRRSTNRPQRLVTFLKVGAGDTAIRSAMKADATLPPLAHVRSWRTPRQEAQALAHWAVAMPSPRSASTSRRRTVSSFSSSAGSARP